MGDQRRMAAVAATIAAVLALGACGSGGGGSSATSAHSAPPRTASTATSATSTSTAPGTGFAGRADRICTDFATRVSRTDQRIAAVNAGGGTRSARRRKLVGLLGTLGDQADAAISQLRTLRPPPQHAAAFRRVIVDLRGLASALRQEESAARRGDRAALERSLTKVRRAEARNHRDATKVPGLAHCS